MTPVLLITLLSAGIVVYASFCRLTKTAADTMPSIRFAIWMLCTTALTAIAAPLLWGWRPDWMHAATFTALAAHQVVTRYTWAHGVPHWFLRGTACHR